MKSNIFQSCVICGSENKVEMHHVRQIKDLKNPNSKLDFFTSFSLPLVFPLVSPSPADWPGMGIRPSFWTNTLRETMG